ncbi:MAG: PEP-CTERM sorting domain-containing protein [Anaerohalosphaeraceae bacterium]|nr:PEP-CTERM sorting domain-containing protein [Anaerohalosphaeraceae bacterium]
MNKLIFVAAVFCVCLMANCVFGNAFYMDLNLTPDQQGFDIIPSEGTVQTTTSPTVFTFHANPGRNSIHYGNHPGGVAGQAFEITLTADITGRGGLCFGVGDFWLAVAYDPIVGNIWVGVFDSANSVYDGISSYIDTSVTHEYRAVVDSAGNYSVYSDNDLILNGDGWVNGDLTIHMGGDFTYQTYTTVANIYECTYIPEPATLLLLGFGGLVLRKKK